jgi:thiol-disulfide isomerase/thioredoxin
MTTNLILVALVQFSVLGTNQQDFDQASHLSLTTGRPLVVLIGAGWCPACQQMKNSILPQVAGTGGLDKVVFTYVDYDQQRELASRLSRGQAIPQLIRFDQTPAGQVGRCLIGAKSPREVHDFINAGLSDKGKASEVLVTDLPRSEQPRSAPKEPPGSAAAVSAPVSHSVADGERGPQSQVSSSPVEETGGILQWLVGLKRLLFGSRDRSGNPTQGQDYPRQARDRSGTGRPAGQAEVAGYGAEPEEAVLRAPGSPPSVSGSTASRHSFLGSDHLQQE